MNYNVENIKTESFGRACRTKLGMYLAADPQKALILGLRELIYNTQDEFEQGYGDTMNIKLNTKTGEIECSDNARGIPTGERSDGTNSLIAAFTMAHTGAKHDTEVYAGAVGINGIGLKVVCHTSQSLTVVVKDGKQKHTLSFKGSENGAIAGKVKSVAAASKTTGTKITYIPDPLVYQNATIDLQELDTTLKELVCFAKGLKITLSVDDKPTKTYKSKNGLIDLLDTTVKLHSTPLSYKNTIGDVKIEFALQWERTNGKLKPYANNLYMPDGGEFMTGFKTSLTKAFNAAAGRAYSGDLIRKYLSGFVSVKVKVPQFSNQAKTSLSNKEARTACSTAITEAFKEFAKRKDLEAIIKYLDNEEKAEIAADKARNKFNNVMAGGKSINKLRDMPSKLADCSGRNGEIFLTEGDSAAGSAKSCRDATKQAIMSLRGKVLNTCSKDVTEMLENKEIKDIVTALGTGVGKKFNINNLRYEKVIIMSDADVDGSHIALLLYTMFLTHMPQLVLNKKLYRAISPLYSVKRGAKPTYFYNQKEYDEYVAKNGQPAHTVRYKGLGELDPEQLWETTMNPETRTLVPITTEELAESQKLIEKLMGKAASERRNFIDENTNDFDFGGQYE